MDRLRAAVTIVTDALGDARLDRHGPLDLRRDRLPAAPRARPDRGRTARRGPPRVAGATPRLRPRRRRRPDAASTSPSTTSRVDAVIAPHVLGRVVAGTPPGRRLVRPAARRRPRRRRSQRIFTLVVEPLETKAVDELRHAAARHGGEQIAAAEGRTRWDAFKARKAAAVDDREHELADGHVPVAYAGLRDDHRRRPRHLATGVAGGAAALRTPPGVAARRCGAGWSSASPPPCRSGSACRGSRSDGRRRRRVRAARPAAGVGAVAAPAALPRHRSTTANVCAIYPAVVQAPLPQVGPLLGIDLTAGDGPLCWDPFEVYSAGLVDQPQRVRDGRARRSPSRA